MTLLLKTSRESGESPRITGTEVFDSSDNILGNRSF